MTCFDHRPNDNDDESDYPHRPIEEPQNDNNNNPSSASEIPPITLVWALNLMIMQQIERQLQHPTESPPQQPRHLATNLPMHSDLFATTSPSSTASHNEVQELTSNRYDINDEVNHDSRPILLQPFGHSTPNTISRTTEDQRVLRRRLLASQFLDETIGWNETTQEQRDIEDEDDDDENDNNNRGNDDVSWDEQ
jgi:hypothetical protein